MINKIPLLLDFVKFLESLFARLERDEIRKRRSILMNKIPLLLDFVKFLESLFARLERVTKLGRGDGF